MNTDEIKITPDKFKTVGKNIEQMESISRPNLSYWQDAWRRIKKNRVAFFSLMLMIFYILFAIFAPIFSPYDFAKQDASSINAPFSLKHWFGTDSLGRDLFVRLWKGARVSLSIGFVAAMLNAIIGTIIGGISGYCGGKVDMLIMRIVDVLYGIPSLIVTILVMVIIGRGVTSLIIAMIIVGWIGSCRFVRGEVLRLKGQEFVLAAKVLGVSDINIILRYLIPNIMGLIITNLTMAIPSAIFSEAFLSFIGLGMAPPNSSWGILAKEGIKLLRISPMQLIIPSFFICTTMLALNLLGDGLRDAFDPRLRGSE
ncbi:ABC transporter permease [Anaerocolumna sp. MB42-C2]|uniref:ABC transporter permease n=1 Tax=Anaerocolumna sp. MB42-C2 TaxID=3070997 RepID=UPI0027E1C1F9|nr:ABC transporter permease [Anaerocolumna sp. MB42-C2]WMJ88177.1 ABC transporter permease [Anaerocolumna sp. MB42-C2]